MGEDEELVPLLQRIIFTDYNTKLFSLIFFFGGISKQQKNNDPFS